MEILAFGAILACLIGKFVLALKAKTLERKLKQEKILLEAAKMEMNRVEGKQKLLKAEKRQLGAKKSTIEKHIGRFNKTLGGYSAQEQKEKAKATEQQELLKEAKKLKGKV